MKFRFKAWDIDHKLFIYMDFDDIDDTLFGRHGIIENTVLEPWQQFVGLHEKWRSSGDKGEEIYANDILKISTDRGEFTSKVYWDSRGARVKTPMGSMVSLNQYEQYSVVGHIYA